MPDVLAAAYSSASLTRFVDEDLVPLLIQLEVPTTRIVRPGAAGDRRSTGSSIVTQLEAEETRLRGEMATARAFHAAQAHLYISAIKALVLRYLDEEGLVAKCLEESKAVARQQQRSEGTIGSQLKGVASIFNPSTWFDAFRPSSLQKAADDFRPEVFWNAMGFPGPHDLRLLSVALGVRGSPTTISYWPPDA